MTGWLGVGRSMNWMVSLWPPGRSTCTGFVQEFTLPSTCPSRALAEIDDGSLSGRSPSRRKRDRSMMLSSAPESTRAAMGQAEVLPPSSLLFFRWEMGATHLHGLWIPLPPRSS